MRWLPFVASLLASLSVAGAAAQQTPDGFESPVDGRLVADEMCSECHVVSRNQKSGEDLPGPDLVVRMRDPGMTGLALRSYLQTSHPIMPNIRLDRDRTDDLIAYLLTLKKDPR